MLRLTPICNVLRISDVNDDQSLVLDSSCSQTATDIAGRGGGHLHFHNIHRWIHRCTQI